MKKLTLLLLALAVVFHSKAQGTLIDGEFMHGDSLRTYKLYIPDACDGSEAWPLVMVLHGFELDAEFIMILSDMNAVADTGHFLVAYPQGLWVYSQTPPTPPFSNSGTGWNAGGELISNNDDVGFLSRMIHKIGLSYRVDPTRVYACGLSNGGHMVYRLACELNDRIAAVVSVSGAMAEDIPCNSGRPVPLMEIHGTADSIVPYGGVPFFMKSIPAAIDFWVKRNQCSDDPAVTIFPDTDTTDGTTVVLKKYGNCQADASVWLMDVVDGGHVWPSQTLPPPPFIGLTNYDVHGSSEIWSFLRQHAHPDPVRTQFPWHHPPAPFPAFPDNLPFGSILQFTDIDRDSTTEAFVLVAGGADVKYYENPGNDSAPQFQFVQSFPFGMPNITGIAPFRYVDIDGDCDVDVFAAILPALGNGLAFIENSGTPEAPWFGDSIPEIQPFGITLPTSDSVPGALPVNNFFRFVDIDADNDFDLFLGGRFVTAGKKVHDENFYYYRNDDPSGEGTAPQFTGPFKNPFNLPRPLIADGAIATNFVDMDCDGDWDLFVIYPGAAVSYFENTGSPTAPDFGKAPTTWFANDPPAPPGFDGYFFGDWLDIGGDGDWDLVQPGTWLENISNGTMACRGSIPQYDPEKCIKIAVYNPAPDAALSLFPNPAGETITCSFQANISPEQVEIGLFDWTGKRVKQFSVRPDGQTWQREISLGGLADGIYLFTLRSEGISVVRRFVKTGH